MPIIYQEKQEKYVVKFDNKKYIYSIKQYGPLAEKLAKQCFKKKRKIRNYIQVKKNFAVMKIYWRKTNKIYDVFVDKKFINKIQNYKWFISDAGNAKTLYCISDKVRLHRFIMNLDRGDKRQIDHINHNGLDNRKQNLRIVNCSENTRNFTVKKNNQFGINGVCYIEASGTHKARYAVTWTDFNGKFHKKSFSVSKYDNALELAIEYRKKMAKKHGYII